MVEGARLESVYTATYRGFESLILRQIGIQQDAKMFIKPASIKVQRVFYCLKRPITSIDIQIF